MHRALRYLRVISIISVKTFFAVEEFINSAVFMQEPFDNRALAERVFLPRRVKMIRTRTMKKRTYDHKIQVPVTDPVLRRFSGSTGRMYFYET